jgi:4-hydroxythreonine-4-phosphate dehydrogenase
VKPLAVTLGDPAGIGPEIVAKALSGLDTPVWIFGSKHWSGPIGGVERFIDVGGTGELRHGTIGAEYGRVALDSIDAALDAIARGECSALVTAPIHKQAIALAGSRHPGHTEILAARAGLHRYGHDYAMYFDSPSLRTVLLSVHVPLRQALEEIDPDLIAALAQLTSREYQRLHGKAPRIAVAGVNPHAGDFGRLGVVYTFI